MKLRTNVDGGYLAVIQADRGKFRTVNLRTKNRTEAESRCKTMNLEQIERAAVAGSITRSLIKKLARGETLNVKDAIERWHQWAQATYESSNSTTNMLTYANAWMRETGVTHLNIDEITENDIDRWVNKSDGCKANTRKFRLATLRSLYFFCKEKGYTDINVADLCGVKYKDLAQGQREARVMRCFTEEEYQAVLAWLRAHIKRLLVRDTGLDEELVEDYRFWVAAVIVGRHSGLRLGDVAGLQRASIRNGRLVVNTDKRNTRVDIEITPELAEGLSMAQKNGKWCWPKQATIESDPSRRAQLPVQFLRILKRSGVANHHFHELRATKLTEMSSNGHSLESIAALAGHSSTETTKGYIEQGK